MSLVFLDTGALYALVDRADPAHSRARDFYSGTKALLLTSDFVFAEAMSLITKRIGKKTAVLLGEAVRGSARVRIEEPTPEVREAAWELFSSRIDKDYDLIDCVSFAMMQANGIREAFGFDRHFTQHGFELVPG